MDNSTPIAPNSCSSSSSSSHGADDLRSRALARRDRLAASANTRLAGILGHTTTLPSSKTPSPSTAPSPVPPSLFIGLLFRIRFLGHAAIGFSLPLLLINRPPLLSNTFKCVPLIVLLWDITILACSHCHRLTTTDKEHTTPSISNNGLIVSYRLLSAMLSFIVHVLFAVVCFCLSHFLIICYLQLQVILIVDNPSALNRLFSSSVLFPYYPTSNSLTAPPSHLHHSSPWRVVSAWHALRLSQAAAVTMARPLFAVAELCGAAGWPRTGRQDNNMDEGQQEELIS
eukprot:GHVS01021588.1.p1 GENE.GHVS01021588.1~~GHVS01021588.1.p1  ORF type:complete len:285 (-),score=57.99 GHVS01021588.1:136-990(-)